MGIREAPSVSYTAREAVRSPPHYTQADWVSEGNEGSRTTQPPSNGLKGLLVRAPAHTESMASMKRLLSGPSATEEVSAIAGRRSQVAVLCNQRQQGETSMCGCTCRIPGEPSSPKRQATIPQSSHLLRQSK